MRPGPALGIPTWTWQGDLNFVLSIGHDEFPRIVLGPGDAEEAYELTRKGLEWAEKYQLPVIILSDKYLSESDFWMEKAKGMGVNRRFSMTKKTKNKGRFKRYRLTVTGVSGRTIPGVKGGRYCSNSYEHEETGLGNESGAMRTLQMDKRMKKLEYIKREIPRQEVYGDKRGKRGIISWGSNKGQIREAIKNTTGIKFLHLSFLWPFPKREVIRFLKSVNRAVVIEQNSTGQLKKLIKRETGVGLDSLLKYNGRPFWPDEILKGVKE